MTDLASEALAILDQQIESKTNLMFPSEYVNKIVCGDCLKVLPKLPDRCVDLCITDPPWGINLWTFREKFKGNSIKNDKTKAYLKLMKDFPSLLYRVMKNNSSIYVFSGGTKPIVPINRHDKIHWSPWSVMELFWKAGFIPFRIIVWDKMSPGRGYRYRMKTEFILNFIKGSNPNWEGEGEFKDDYIRLEDTEIIHYPRVHGSKKVHHAEKPVRLLEAFILDASSSGELILDPFAGSGSIIEACKNTRRKYFAIDSESANIPLMHQREKQISMFELIEPKIKKQVEQVELDIKEN